MKGIIGKKLGMTQLYDDKGILTPVTILQAGPCHVIQVKTKAKDGYSALQIGYGRRKSRNTPKPLAMHCKKAGLENPAEKIKEIRFEGDPEQKVGDVIGVDTFLPNEFVDITGITKGKGFQGVVRKYHFAGGMASHGGGWHRRPGSIGCKEKPGNIIKGKKMPGHLGNVSRTVQNLQVMKIDTDDNVLFIKGALPGPNGGIVLVRSAIKKKKTQSK